MGGTPTHKTPPKVKTHSPNFFSSDSESDDDTQWMYNVAPYSIQSAAGLKIVLPDELAKPTAEQEITSELLDIFAQLTMDE